MKEELLKIALVSRYPPKQKKHCYDSGLMGYSKNLALGLLQLSKKLKVTVFADKLSNHNLRYVEEGVEIIRCWEKGIIFPLQITKALFNHEPFNIIHIQHEFFHYGGIFSAIFFLFLIFVCRFYLSKPVLVTLHGVISLLNVNKQFTEENKIKGNPWVIKKGLAIINKFIVSLSSLTIVHEQVFKQRLVVEYGLNKNKICVVPHGIEAKQDVFSSNQAKTTLGLYKKRVILFFGFLAPYKGIELLLKAFKQIAQKYTDLVLLVAGGIPSRLNQDKRYNKYYSHLRSSVSPRYSEQIIFAGFVPECKIPLYFNAADMIVFPYKTVIASSGPLAMSITYEKPILVSNSFNALIELKSCIFEKNPGSLASKMEEMLNSYSLRCEIINYVKKLKEEHSWKIIGEKHLKIYHKAINSYMVRTR